MQRFIERLNCAVHTESIGMLANITVYKIREIKWQRTFGEVVNIALR